MTRQVAGATAPSELLARIVARRRERLAHAGQSLGPLGTSASASPSGTVRRLDDNRFVEALRARRGRAVIAEVKMGSPRIGSLAGRFDPERVAHAYATHGAAALSVVVEPDFFGGSYELLARCVAASGLPAIAKDFVVHPSQLESARAAGAAAVLLIAAMHAPEELANLAAAARALGLAPLVETHTAEDIAKLAGGDWEMVGINNRDLRTFEVDLERSMRLAPTLPGGALKIAESGIRSSAEIGRLAQAGFDGFLIGESFLLAKDPGGALAALLAAPGEGVA